MGKDSHGLTTRATVFPVCLCHPAFVHQWPPKHPTEQLLNQNITVIDILALEQTVRCTTGCTIPYYIISPNTLPSEHTEPTTKN